MTDECCSDVNQSKIKLEEKGRKAVVLNDARVVYRLTKVDGCLIKGAPAADWVIARAEKGDVIVELKGCDVDHAIEQVTATLRHWVAAGLTEGRMAALVVCSHYPRIDTKIQRAKNAIARDYAAPLHVVARNLEYSFDALLSMRGPHQV